MIRNFQNLNTYLSKIMIATLFQNHNYGCEDQFKTLTSNFYDFKLQSPI